MKRFVLCLFAGSMVLMARAQETPPAQDVIRTKAGLEITGTVSRSGKDNLQVTSRSASGAFVKQQVPLSNVDRVDFAGADKVDAELDRYTAANLPLLLQKWRLQRDLLDIPESPAGAYGVRAAELLLESDSPQAASSAGEILDQILQKAWDKAEKDRARTLTIESLRRSGKHDETLKAAREFLATDATAESKAEVSYFLALALMDDYRKFILENPRWESDPYMRPKRGLLYNELLDNMLAPYLRYGAPPKVTAKSLLAGAKFLDECGDKAESRVLAQDVVKIFAAQSEAAEAKKFLEEK